MSRNFPLASDPRKVIARSFVPAKDNPQSPEKVNARDQRVRDEAKQVVALEAGGVPTSQRAVRAGCWGREGREGALESAGDHSSPTRRVLVSERVDDVAPSKQVA